MSDRRASDTTVPIPHDGTVAMGWYLLALGVGVAIVLGDWFVLRRSAYPILPDTTAYLEMARSFLQHGRFETVPWALTEPSVTTAPTGLWPPLYPLVIAALSTAGVPDLIAAPLINRCCFAVLPALLLWAVAGTVHPVRIILAASLALTATGVLATQYFGLSEGLTAVLIVLSVGYALRTERSMLLFLSGLCGAAAYVARNPALAVCLAIPLWLLLDGDTLSTGVRRALVWVAGALVVLVPLWTYDLRVFGTVQPYVAARATTGVLYNARVLAVSMVGELVGARGTDRWLSRGVPALLALCALLGVALWAWRALPPRDRRGRAVRLLVLVSGAMSALLVAAASRYQFQGLNEHRFLVPYLWAALAAAAILFPPRTRGARLRPLMLAATLVMVVARGYDSWRRLTHVAQADGAIAVAGDTDLGSYLRTARSTVPFLASNAAWILRAETRVLARQLSFCPEYADQLAALTTLVAQGRAVEVVLTDRVDGAQCEDAWARALVGAGFGITHTTSHAVIYRKDPTGGPVGG